MTITCDIVTDNLHLSEAVHGIAIDFARDTATPGDAVGIGFATIARDTLTFTEQQQGYNVVVASDSLNITDGANAGGNRGNVVNDAVRIRDRARASIVAGASDIVTFADNALNDPAPVVARDRLTFSDHISAAGHTGNIVNDVLRIRDKAHAQISAVASDTLTFADDATHAGGANRVSDSITIGDSAGSGSAGSAVARDALHIGDRGLHVSAIGNIARDSFFVADDAIVEGDLGGAWACPTDGYSMTRYTHRRLTSIGIVGECMLVSGEGGIYALNGVDDDGDPINAHAETGLIQVSVPEARDPNAKDDGDPRIKAGSYVSMAYSGGRMRFGIGITRSGKSELRYWYPFPARDAIVPTTTRAKVGRGARSGFWRFLLENIEGDGFMVKEQRVKLDPLSRRI